MASSREMYKCPHCDFKVPMSEIEKEDGFCPECGQPLLASSLRDNFDEIDEDVDSLDMDFDDEEGEYEDEDSFGEDYDGGFEEEYGEEFSGEDEEDSEDDY